MRSARLGVSTVWLCLAVSVMPLIARGTTIAEVPTVKDAKETVGAGLSKPLRQKLKGGHVVGDLKPSTLEQRIISISLPGGQVVVAELEHLTRQPRLAATTWYGRTRGKCAGSLSITSTPKVMAGSLSHCGNRYEFDTSAGATQFYSVPTTPPVGELPPRHPTSSGDASFKRAGDRFAAADTGDVIHDILIVTTPGAREQYGSSLDGMIINAVADANAAYRTGGVGITLNLVGLAPSGVPDGTGSGDTLDALTQDAAVGALRTTTGADVVIAIRRSGGGGLAYLMTRLESWFDRFAYGVVSADMLTLSTLAHEVGHIQGLKHDRQTAMDESSAGILSATPYGFGFRVCTSDSTGVRDIMAYPCTTGFASRINQFSDPNATIKGYVFGVPYETDPVNAADNVRALKASAATVASFRAPVLWEPIVPTDLRITGNSASGVALTWKDNATNEDGYSVERSTDNSVWTEIARVGADTTEHRDASVTPATAYFWRVKAFNSAGYSRASASVSATTVTPDSTPNAFTFPTQTGVPLSTIVTSTSATLADFEVPVSIAVTNGAYSIGCADIFTASTGSVSSGQTVCVRHASAAAFSTSTTTTLTVGGVAGTFTSTTIAADATPNQFSFSSAANVEPSTVVRSEAVTITGYNAPAAVTVTGGEYSIGCTESFTSSSGPISPGQSLCVRHTSNSNYSAKMTTTVTVGGINGSFVSSTRSRSATGGGSSSGGGGGGSGSYDWLALLFAVAIGARRLRHVNARVPQIPVADLAVK